MRALAEGLATRLSAERGPSRGGGFTVFEGKAWYARPGGALNSYRTLVSVLCALPFWAV